MAPTKKKTKIVRNPKGGAEHLKANKYVVAEVLDEVRRDVNVERYDEIVSWALSQPYSKVKFCVDKCTDLPMVVKSICAALLADMKWGRIVTVQMALERIIGKPVERQHVNISDDTPKLTINVSNDVVQSNLDKLIGGVTRDEDYKDV